MYASHCHPFVNILDVFLPKSSWSILSAPSLTLLYVHLYIAMPVPYAITYGQHHAGWKSSSRQTELHQGVPGCS